MTAAQKGVYVMRKHTVTRKKTDYIRKIGDTVCQAISGTIGIALIMADKAHIKLTGKSYFFDLDAPDAH